MARTAAASGAAPGPAGPGVDRPADPRGARLAAAGHDVPGPLAVDAAGGFPGPAVSRRIGQRADAPGLVRPDAKAAPGGDPYFLYAASNLGSLLALLAYPLVIEAKATLTRQSGAWAIGYGLLMALIAACAVRLWRSAVLRPSIGARMRTSSYSRHERSPISAMRRRLRWLALSLVPSSLLLGVTTYISSEITPMPFLWVVPLALYLLTFVLVFAPRTILPLRWMVRLQPLLIVVAAATPAVHWGGNAGSSPFRVVAPGNLLRDRDGLPWPTGGRPPGTEPIDRVLSLDVAGRGRGRIVQRPGGAGGFQQRAGISADDGRGLPAAAAVLQAAPCGNAVRAAAGDGTVLARGLPRPCCSA